ncbi:MAG: hypothetical protein ACK56R_05530 [Pirellulaceae bacterium]
MSGLQESVLKVLGRRLDPQHSSFYDLLGISRDADEVQVRNALQRSIELLKQYDKVSDPGPWEVAARLVQQAKATLLDPSKRELYNRKLVDAAVELPVGAEESKWFPQGDPRALFDAAGLLQEDADWPDWMETDEQRLSTWTAVLGQGQALPRASAAIESRPSSAGSGSPVGQGARRLSAVGGKTAANPRSAAMPRARKDAQRLQWILLASASVAAMSGAAWFYFRSTQNRQAAEVAQARLGEQTAPTATVPVPSQNPTAPALVAPRNPSPAMPTLAQGGDKFRLDSGMANAQGLEQKIAQANSNDMATDGVRTEADSTATAQPPAAAPADSPMESEAPATEPSPVPMPMSATDRLLYADAMRQVLQAIKNQNFSKAETQLDTAKQLAMAPPESDQVARLEMATKMSKRFDEAMRQAGLEMSAGSSFDVLGHQVAFVEAHAERLVVRVAGKNESHPWSAMPVGIAIGLADLQLDQSNAIDLGCRGVYCGLSATANALSKKLAREYLQKATAADDGMRLPRDFEKLLDDQYDAPAEPASP